MSVKFSDSKTISFIIRYGFAFCLVGLALALTLLIWAFIESLASPLFLLAIIVTSWYGGMKPGVLATLLSGFAINYFFIDPTNYLSGSRDDILRILIFTLEGYAFCWLITWRTEAAEEIKLSSEQLRALSLRQQTLIEDERKRIALEIHDELGQILTGLKMEIHLLKNKIKKNSFSAEEAAELDAKVNTSLQLIDTTIAAVRRISTDLRPPILDDLGLVAAIEWQSRDFQRRTGIPCNLTTNVEIVNLSSDFSIAFFRIFQETLTNITRHAIAKNVFVKLERKNRNLILRVEDDGIGIQADNIDSGVSLGILGMRERARLIGGILNVFKGNKGGTVVELTAPLG
jgi:signal transduction histidine kinase